MKLEPLHVPDRPNLAAAQAWTNTPAPPHPHRLLAQHLPAA
ncbi:hypothetical protein JOF29_000032 [Kribbella aluminosa]|uniref:GNAT family N-acetyltransferase n=1 Tax=Kribbella aluminosa TaxID=416017 RepID=A0ABS4UBE1_9ACTN|nr:hypothetical protein [Kribbella aluminosa]MBP2348949.1 hypothetical protein [Kribbella aluminosa]